MTQKETVHQLNYLNSLILLAKKLLELGFYTELKEINSLVRGMNKVLSNSFYQAESADIQNLVFRRNSTARIQQNDAELALGKLKDCRVSICNLFEFIQKIQVLLKQYTLMFRLKNLIQTSFNTTTVKDYDASDKSGLIRYQGHHIHETDLTSKIGFLINNMCLEEGFIKLASEQHGIKDFVRLLIAMSKDSNATMKKITMKMILFMFSDCLNLTESISKVICIDASIMDTYDKITNIHKDINKLMLQYRTMSEITEEYLDNHLTILMHSLSAILFRHSSPKQESKIKEPDSEVIIEQDELSPYDSFLLKLQQMSIPSSS